MTIVLYVCEAFACLNKFSFIFLLSELWLTDICTEYD